MANNAAPKAAPDRQPRPKSHWQRFVYWTLLAALPAAGLLAMWSYGRDIGSGRFAVIGVFMCGTALLLGGLVGFLFGIPRTLGADSGGAEGVAASGAGAGSSKMRPQFGPNTNLEQISDWLTKVLVGATLVEMGNIGPALRGIGDFVKADLVGHVVDGTVRLGQFDGVVTLVVAAILYFSSAGFLGAYLWTRLEFGGLLAQSDRETLERLDIEVPELRRQLSEGEVLSRALASVVADTGVERTADMEALRVAMPAEVFTALEALRQRPANWKADDVAELFAGLARNPSQARALTATAERFEGPSHLVQVRLTSTDAKALEGEVQFLLHSTFPVRIYTKRVHDGACEFSFLADGAFTVGAVCDGGESILLVDLEKIPGVAPEFASG